MILFTSGFPYSGKTTFAAKLCEKLKYKHILHIDPKNYYLEEFDDLSLEDQSAVAVEAWEMALEQATKSICALPNKALIIFDTCCNKALHMRPLFMNSKLRGHDILMAFVSANQSSRFERAPNERVKEYEDKYRINFIETLPILKKLSDYFMMVDNSGKESDLDKYVELISDKIKSIRDG